MNYIFLFINIYKSKNFYKDYLLNFYYIQINKVKRKREREREERRGEEREGERIQDRFI